MFSRSFSLSIFLWMCWHIYSTYCECEGWKIGLFVGCRESKTRYRCRFFIVQYRLYIIIWRLYTAQCTHTVHPHVYMVGRYRSSEYILEIDSWLLPVCVAVAVAVYLCTSLALCACICTVAAYVRHCAWCCIWCMCAIEKRFSRACSYCSEWKLGLLLSHLVCELMVVADIWWHCVLGNRIVSQTNNRSFSIPGAFIRYWRTTTCVYEFFENIKFQTNRFIVLVVAVYRIIRI